MNNESIKRDGHFSLAQFNVLISHTISFNWTPLNRTLLPGIRRYFSQKSPEDNTMQTYTKCA